jgi:fibronectin type III domain protein
MLENIACGSGQRMNNLSKFAAHGCLRVFFFFSLLPPAQAAQSIVLKWDPAPSSNVSGYRLYYGSARGVYTQKLEVGNMTSTLVSNLSEGRTYFFAVAAYNRAAESPRSNEISYTVPSSGTPQKSATQPTPTPIPPRTVTPPATLTDVRDMREVQPQLRSTSLEASAYGRWCRGEP